MFLVLGPSPARPIANRDPNGIKWWWGILIVVWLIRFSPNGRQRNRERERELEKASDGLCPLCPSQ